MSTDEFDPAIAEVVSRLEKLGQPALSATARQRIWQKARGQAGAAVVMPVPRSRRTLAFWRVLTGVLVAFILMFAGTVWVAAQSLPGDALYPLARGLETARLALAPAAQRASLELQFLDRRATEIRALVELGRPVPPEIIAEIVGGIEQLVSDPDAWGGEAVVAACMARQEETLALVVARYPEYDTAASALEIVRMAQRNLHTDPLSPTPEEEYPTPPGQGGTPPGQEDKDITPPGQGGTPPGQEDKDTTPPGQGGTPPGQEDKDTTPPGQGGTPPGQEDKDTTPPGQGGTPPGQEDKDTTPPGQGGTPPGQEDKDTTPPGQGEDPPPGQGGTPPGQQKKD